MGYSDDMQTRTTSQKPHQGKNLHPHRWHRGNQAVSRGRRWGKSYRHYDGTSGVPEFKNGALTGSFSYLFGSVAQKAQAQLAQERSLRFGSVADMEAAMGPNAYTTGGRPLEPLGGDIVVHGQPGGALDVSNTELLHEHFFYTDQNSVLHNVGFSPNGLLPDKNFPANITQFRFTPITHLSAPINPAVLNPAGFAGKDYRFFTHNCQDYCSAVRKGLSGP